MTRGRSVRRTANFEDGKFFQKGRSSWHVGRFRPAASEEAKTGKHGGCLL